MLKKIILSTFILSASLYADKVYTGIAHHEHQSYFGNKERSYAITITFLDNNSVTLSLPEYDCLSELILQNQNGNVYTYAEEHISGQCKSDGNADTQIRIREGKLDYLFQSNTDTISASLLEQ